MTIEHRWGHATGRSFDEMSLLGYRWDSRWGFIHTEMDSHILLVEPTQLRAPLLKSGWLTGAWRSNESQITFVSDSRSSVHRVFPTIRADGDFVDTHDFPSTMAGVWGLDDQHVYAWGESSPEASQLYRWDGTQWHDMECPGPIYAMHGIAPDLIYAVGDLGMIARWDGHRWTKFGGGTRARLASVFVVSPDEMYACGVHDGVLEGSVHGWARVLSGEGPYYSIAKFAGRVLVACGPDGLFEVKRNQLDLVTADMKAEKLEAREQLIVTCPDCVYVTPDFSAIRGLPLDQFEPLVQHRPPAWVTHPP